MRINRSHVLLALLLALVTLQTGPASAAPTLAERLARADQDFARQLEKMDAKQQAYKGKHGRYWQGLNTHATPPSTTSKHPDNWFSRPSDQRGQGWDKMIDFEALPYSLRVDVYSGPDGDGWVMCAQVTEGGAVYERCQGDGAEDRDNDWQQVVTP